MKIESGRGVASAGGSRRAGRAAAPGFAPEGEAASGARATGPVRAVTALEALLALQGEEDIAEIRARQFRRGNAVLNALERLAKGIALGSAPASLRAELEYLRRDAAATGDAGLDAALLEIDTRLAVELAKLDVSLRRA